MSQLMVSFHGSEAPEWVLQGIARGRIRAVCLFAYNVSSTRQLRSLTSRLTSVALEAGLPPPLIGIDQEGGQVMAVGSGTTELPGNMALGAAGSEELASEAGRVLGLELRALGVNLNFAPVLDLAAHLDSQVVGNRAFGDDPQLVARLGAAFVRGMQATGVLATAKHFPGHGGTSLDSHHVSPVIERDLERLLAADLAPFSAAIAAGLAAVMTAHVTYPALDDRPATLSRRILTDLLRGRLSFTGLTISDAMDMEAVADRPAAIQAAAAIEAGVDLVMLGHLPDQAELVELLHDGARPEAVRRIEAARALVARSPVEPRLIGCDEHLDIAQRIADSAVTVIRAPRRFPLDLAREETLGLVRIEATRLTPADSTFGLELQLSQQLSARHGNLREIVLPHGASAREVESAVESLRGCPAVVVGTINATEDEAQRLLLRRLDEAGLPLYHLALRSPADALHSPLAATAIATYGVRAPNTEAAVRVLFGELIPTGRLPVRLEPPHPTTPEVGATAS